MNLGLCCEVGGLFVIKLVKRLDLNDCFLKYFERYLIWLDLYGLIDFFFKFEVFDNID